MILLLGTFNTKGMSGLPGGGFPPLAATLASLGHLPAAAVALLRGVGRFMGEARDGALDRHQAPRVLGVG